MKTFCWIVKAGVKASPDLSAKPKIVPCGTFAWVADRDLNALLTDGAVQIAQSTPGNVFAPAVTQKANYRTRVMAPEGRAIETDTQLGSA